MTQNQKGTGKVTKHLSERRFRHMLGLTPVVVQSGDSKKSYNASGSSLCRRIWWTWIFTAVEVRARRPKGNQIIEKLALKLDTEKIAGRPIRLVRVRVASYGARLLFRELVKEFSHK
ncbi:MAG: transposase [Calothrix sp. SM1_7_51]|nr:transposase [Calothrix sp. SM1_7_51]